VPVARKRLESEIPAKLIWGGGMTDTELSRKQCMHHSGSTAYV